MQVTSYPSLLITSYALAKCPGIFVQRDICVLQIQNSLSGSYSVFPNFVVAVAFSLSADQSGHVGRWMFSYVRMSS